MFKRFSFTKELSKEEELQEYLAHADKLYQKNLNRELKSLAILNYHYVTDEAVDELGLDDELIHDLLEDFVAQIVKYKPVFMMYIDRLKVDKKSSIELNYTPLRELAHKNLGVARNLRIKDAQKLLDELMKKDDLEYLTLCASTLEASVIKIKPEVALKTSKLMQIKVSL